MVGPSVREHLSELGRSIGRSGAVAVICAYAIAAIDVVAAAPPWQILPAAGFLLLAFFAPVCGAAVLARLCARGWWPKGSGGAEPRRAAAVIYAGAGAAIALAAIYRAGLVARHMTSARVAVAGATAFAAVAVIAVIAGMAPLACRLLGAALEAAAARLGRWAPLLLSRRGVFAWVGVAMVSGAYLFYRLALSPRLDDLAFAWMPPLALGAAVMIAGHAALPARLGRIAAAAIAALAAIAVASSLVVRYASPRVMLDLWGATAATSEAVAMLYDLEPIHEQYGVAPAALRPGAEPLDVVLITVDTWRADRTPLFGAGASMPAFIRFANESIRFTQALAPSNNTRRSLTSMMIGAQPSRVRGRIKGWALALDPRHTLVAERFRAAGYQTAGFFCCRSLFDPARGTGFSRGFERRIYIKSDAELADAAAAYLGKTLATRPGASRPPVFVWIHMLGPHGWYRGSTPIPGKVARRRYDRALSRVDDALEVVLEPLEAVRDRAVVVLTSDHGEGLADHGAIRHSSGLYQSQLRVPLVISTPGSEPRAIATPVSLVDLAPALLELAGFERPPERDRGSLAPLVRGEAGAGVVYAEQIPDRSVDEALWAVVAEGHKLIVDADGDTELYALEADPGETDNLAGTRPALERRLRQALEERRTLGEQPAW